MRRPYSLKILWHGRNRFLPAVLAVSFSAVLIAVQLGVLLGTLAVTSKPIDHASAHIWVGIRDVPSIELGHPIPESWLFRLQAQPEVEDAEGYLYEFNLSLIHISRRAPSIAASSAPAWSIHRWAPCAT